MTTSRSDNDLLSRITAGDSKALGVILERFWAAVVRYCSAALASADAGEDVAQETFVRLWERREAWRAEGSVRALLYKIARNLVVDELRRVGARRRADSRAPTPSSTGTPDELFDTEEMRAAMCEAVERLPARRREVFVLVRHHGLSYREAAEVLGLAPQTVANHLTLAMIDLKKALEPHLYEESAAAESLDRRLNLSA